MTIVLFLLVYIQYIAYILNIYRFLHVCFLLARVVFFSLITLATSIFFTYYARYFYFLCKFIFFDIFVASTSFFDGLYSSCLHCPGKTK